MRQPLLDESGDFFFDSQCGGMPHLATDMAHHPVTEHMAAVAAQQTSLGVLFVNASNAFYGVIRQTLADFDGSDQQVAAI